MKIARLTFINIIGIVLLAFAGCAEKSKTSHVPQAADTLYTFSKIEQDVRSVTAREHSARYAALEKKMEAERQQAKADKARQQTIIISIIFVLVVIFTVILIFKNMAISRKNRILAQQISEAVNYKKKYWEERRAQTLNDITNLNDLTDEQLYQYIHEVIVSERIFLNPSFNRQTIMDRFQISKERVGSIFSHHSDYSKLTNYVQQLRLDYAAKQLLEQPEKSIVQIASECGFSSNSYFSDRFRQHFGMSPTVFRQKTSQEKQ